MGVTQLLEAVAAMLHAHRDELDALNVFPVPDGDTGSNLARTAAAALVGAQQADADGRDPVAAAVDAGVRGARGNSGVIASQVLRAWCEEGLGGATDPAAVARSMQRAHELGAAAVAEPVEGTILTVLRVVAEEVARARDDDVARLLRRLVEVADDAVERTPEQLDVLRRAGKVDAGARGLALMLDAAARVAAGETVDAAPPAPRETDPSRPFEAGIAYDGPRWEVMYVVPGSDDAVVALRDGLRSVGDSVVVVGTGSVVSAHVHTDDIGAALEAGLAHGAPADVRVEDLRARPCEPVEATTVPGHGAEGSPDDGEDRLAVVAVLPGEGLAALARAHGVRVVHGGSGDLPSVADLLDAVVAAAGDRDRVKPPVRVALLPGHRNAVPAAERAAALARDDHGVQVEVVVAADAPPRVLAGLALLAPGAAPEDALEGLHDAATRVRCAEVVPAVRTADTEVGLVRAGDLLAVAARGVVHAGGTAAEAVAAAVLAIASAETELVTLVAGVGVSAEEREVVTAAVEGLDGATLEVDVVEGTQTPVRWFVGVE